ncbi:translational elongation factor EF-1 alpha, partial [Lunasporangiospora selenospora]
MSAPLIDAIIKAENTEQRQAAADALAAFAKSEGLVKSVAVIESLAPLLDNKKSIPHREGALLALGSLATSFGQAAEPFLIPQMPKVFELYSDKIVVVREAASKASKAIMALPTRYAVRLLLPVIFHAIKESKWQSKIGAMDILSGLTNSAPQQISAALSDIIPVVSEAMWDSKPEVRNQATKTTTDCFNVVGNPDLTSSIPYLVGCINRPEEAADCIHQLAATTFVTTVEEPTLAIMCPLLVRGLAERSPAIQRQTAVIVDNMCKLIENPAHAQQFLPKLLPGLDRMIEIAASPELRSVAERARATLVRVGGGEPGSKDQVVIVAYTVTTEEVLEVLKAKATFVKEDAFSASVLKYIASLCSTLIASRNFEKDAWVASVVPYLTVLGAEAEVTLLANDLNAFYVDFDTKNAFANKATEGIEEGELLCDCEFSLAYGGMILLNKTRLNLRRGQRYGLCGPNGAGKSTLMRAIAE